MCSSSMDAQIATAHVKSVSALSAITGGATVVEFYWNSTSVRSCKIISNDLAPIVARPF